MTWAVKSKGLEGLEKKKRQDGNSEKEEAEMEGKKRDFPSFLPCGKIVMSDSS